jgi:dihydrofolate reductase
MINAIAAVDLNWGIGNNGNLLTRIPEDMRRFKQLTLNNVVVMGRKTYQSLPFGIPLKDRINIIMTRDRSFRLDQPSALVVRSEDEMLEKIKIFNVDTFIIGGGEIYKQLLYLCDNIYITQIQKRFECDTYMENLNLSRDFKISFATDAMYHNDIGYNFVTYEKKKKRMGF